MPLANPCDVTGSVNLSGSFTITSQQQDTATGIADLSGILSGGPLSGQPVRFVIAFTGTADASNNITASLTSIVVTGAFSATGGPPTTPPGTFTGILTGNALSGSATGTLHTAGRRRLRVQRPADRRRPDLLQLPVRDAGAGGLLRFRQHARRSSRR